MSEKHTHSHKNHPSHQSEEVKNESLETHEELENVGDLKKSLEEMIEERDELKNQLLRSFADFQNFRKRAQHEKEELRKHATEQLVRDLLSILDNFERTLVAIENGADMNAVVEGIKLVDREFRGVLDRVHVKRLIALGEIFDPAHHEAIDAVVSDEHPEGTIVEELKPGYKMAEKVIRPALVRVTKKQ